MLPSIFFKTVNARRAISTYELIEDYQVCNDKTRLIWERLKNEHREIFVRAQRNIAPLFQTDFLKLMPYTEIPFVAYDLNLSSFIIDFQRTVLSNQKYRRANTQTLLISGSKGSGKTTLALRLALISQATFISFLTSNDFVGLTEKERDSKLESEFDKSKSARYSVIILEDLETYLTDYPSKLVTLLMSAHDVNLYVIATTSQPFLFNRFLSCPSFIHFRIKDIKSRQEVLEVLRTLTLEERICELIGSLPAPFVIKELMQAIQSYQKRHERWDTLQFLKELANFKK